MGAALAGAVSPPRGQKRLCGSVHLHCSQCRGELHPEWMTPRALLHYAPPFRTHCTCDIRRASRSTSPPACSTTSCCCSVCWCTSTIALPCQHEIPRVQHRSHPAYANTRTQRNKTQNTIPKILDIFPFQVLNNNKSSEALAPSFLLSTLTRTRGLR